jgi:hypothetical protein
MKKIKNFSEFLNEGLFDNPVLRKLGSILSGNKDSSTSNPEGETPIIYKTMHSGKSWIIGDSIVPNFAENPYNKTNLALFYTETGVLWKSGIGIKKLLEFANAYTTIQPTIGNVIITIGTNDLYNRSEQTVIKLAARLKILFPNAELFVIQGGYGPLLGKGQNDPYGTLKILQEMSQSKVNTYYKDFSDNGITVITPAIGNVADVHNRNLPIYETIGKKLKPEIKKDETNDVDTGDLKEFNFHQIPDKLNNWRSAQITADLLPSVIKKYKIKNIIRMSGDDEKHMGKHPKTSTDTEKKICEENGCTYNFINSHGDFKSGKGYTTSIQKTSDILSKGNTLIHCAHGADRTGGMVGAYLKNKGHMTNKDELWKYTTQYNGWQKMVDNNNFFGTGYDKYADGFYPISELKNSKWVK